MIKFLNGSLVVSDSVRWAPVVHFDQRLGTVHSKRWLKYVFSLFVVQKMKKARKSKKLDPKFSLKIVFSFSLHQNVGRGFYSQNARGKHCTLPNKNGEQN